MELSSSRRCPGCSATSTPTLAIVLDDPNGRLLIADGRNHVELTERTYDIIMADPPPPIESAGTGVLYAPREFYAAAARRLQPGRRHDGVDPIRPDPG